MDAVQGLHGEGKIESIDGQDADGKPDFILKAGKRDVIVVPLAAAASMVGAAGF